MNKNKNLFNMLINSNKVIKTLELTSHEKYPLISAISNEIAYRLDNNISKENGEDIISLRNVLENLSE